MSVAPSILFFLPSIIINMTSGEYLINYQKLSLKFPTRKLVPLLRFSVKY